MSDPIAHLIPSTDKSAEQAASIVGQLLRAAQPGAVYGEPVTVGDHTVITASEVSAGGGFGLGGGLGPAHPPGARESAGEDAPRRELTVAGGSGAGAGGGSMGRPVAVIILGPEGVKVRPVVDVTKIALAGIAAWGAISLVLGKTRRANRG